MTTTETMINKFYRMQETEIHGSGGSVTWDNVLDDEQTWIISNYPDLYIIEQASDELQRSIRNINIDRSLINEIITTHNANAKGIPPIAEMGQGARRIIFSPGDFKHDGNVHVVEPWGLIKDPGSGYSRNLNKLKKSIHEALVDTPYNNEIKFSKCFVCMLSLGFGQGQGGHFGALVGELNVGAQTIQCAVVDPYGMYAPVFRYLFEEAFKGLKNGYYVYDLNKNTYSTAEQKTPVSESAFFPYKFIWRPNIVTTYLESISRTNSGIPTTLKDQYGVQSYWGQDHFCFMWCIMFIHRFLITGTIASMNDLYNEINRNPNINIVIIKAYIIQLLQLMKATIPTSTFFDVCFKHIWTCYTVKNLPASPLNPNPNGPLPPADQTLYAPTIPMQFYTYEIKYTQTGRFLFEGTVDSLGITQLVLATLPSITSYNSMSCTNTLVDKQAILAQNTIPDDLIEQNNIKPTNSIYKIMYFYINNFGAFVNSDYIYTKFTDKTTGAISMPASCPSQDADYIIKYMNLSPSMKDFEGNYCKKLEHAINNRNKLYMEQNMLMSCDKTGGPNRKLHIYQQKAVDVMIDKAHANAPSGLLVWFGTGRGKTITANVAAKITTVCKQNYRRCFIVSTKSVYKQFAYSLGNDTDITPDALLPNPTNPNQTQNAAYYDRHTMSGNFFPNLLANNLPETDLYVFSSTRFKAILMDMETGDVKAEWIPYLNGSLIIIDEAHKIINIDGKMEGEYRFFNSCCKAARQVMLMTATPMVNSPYDLELLMALVDRRDPESRAQFREWYVGTTNITSNQADICGHIDQNGNITQDQGIDKVNFNLSVTYTRRPTKESSADIRFGNRIIYAMSTGNLPANIERKLCVWTNIQSQIDTLLQRPTTEVANSDTSIPRSFGSNETRTLLYGTIKTNVLLQIIKARENTPSVDVIDTDSVFIRSYPPLQPMKFKYVIYSQSTTFLNNLKKELISSGVPLNMIDSITGETQDRKKVTKKYNSGAVRILLITDAAMEGVDLRRTAMVILAEPVWTKSKYDQIIGRGVRDSSGQRLKVSDYEDIVKRIEEKKKTIVATLVAERQNVDDEIADKRAQLIRTTSARITQRQSNEILALQKRVHDINDSILQSDLYKNYIITCVDNFKAGNLQPINALTPNPYSDILNEELDFCEIPATVDCMTLILSYSTRAQGGVRYSIDTYKYNAMRVKNSEITNFAETILKPSFITY